MHAGSAVDAGLNHNYFHQALSGKPEPLSAIEDATREEFDKGTDVDWEYNKPDDVFDKCRGIVQVFRKEIIPTVNPGKDEDGLPLVQKRLSHYCKPLNAKLLGYVDLIEEDGTAVDNKTTYGKRWSALRNYNNHQAGSYVFLAQKELGSATQKFRFDIATSLKTKSVYNQYPLVVDEDYINAVQSEQANILLYLRLACDHLNATGDDGLFFCNTQSNLCSKRYCQYAYLCEAELNIRIKN